MLKKIKNKYLELKWNLYEKHLIKPLSRKSFKGLENKTFSIFANNCAAGFIYQDTGLPYLTPTVGLFFHSPCYIKLLQNFYWINEPLRFIEKSKYETANLKRIENNDFYPIAIIGEDVEIHFLHYKSNEEATEKWGRRLTKLDYNNLLILYSVRDLASDDHVRTFCKLPFKHKLCISAKEFPELKDVIAIKKYKSRNELPPANLARIRLLKIIKFAPILNRLTT